MKLLFLGTGADDWPKKTEDEMTPEIRRRCSLLIDDHILMDIAKPSFGFAERLGVDVSLITDVIISHMHGDHYNKECLLQYRQHTPQNINIWCHEGAVDKLKLSEEEKKLFDVHPLSVGEFYKISNYYVRTLGANHFAYAPEQSLHYVFDDGKKRVFYGCDGAFFLDETWAYIRKIKFDGMILDATFGREHPGCIDGGHNTTAGLKLILNSLKRESMLATDRSVVVADHLSKGGYENMEKTAQLFKDMGMLMAYDGMELMV